MGDHLYKIGPCTGHLDVRQDNGEHSIRDLQTVSSRDGYRVEMTLNAWGDRQRIFKRSLVFSDVVWHYDCEFPGKGRAGNNMFEPPANRPENEPDIFGNLLEYSECELALAWSPSHCYYSLTLSEVEVVIKVVATGYSFSPILEASLTSR